MTMSDIVLATLNARYIHCSFGLRYLLANMGDLAGRTQLLEFTIQQPTLEIADAIIACQPRIVGFGVYIWNVEETTRLVADLKRIQPDLIIVLGGPEVSYETDDLPIVRLADRVITGEADLEFPRLCRQLLQPVSDPNDRGAIPFVHDRMTISAVPVLTDIQLPYAYYSDDDIAHRVIYVEASRGCPFTCEFCLSALDIPVRQFPLELFLSAMKTLLDRGVRQFKFVDRTFNLNLRVGRAILQFFLDHFQDGLFLHFEMIPDRLPDALKDLIVQFPAGALQFEVGIQTFNPDVGQLISRQQNNDVVDTNLTWLRQSTGVHVHADLIVGLPGETLESFAAGFDRLVGLKPQEIQVGILKRLRGTPIVRHDDEWQMVYSPHPPYEILSNRLMSYPVIQELRRFAKFWDAIANSGNFVDTLSLLWTASRAENGSPFYTFRTLANWLFECEKKTSGIPLGRLVERLFEYLTGEIGVSPDVAAKCLWNDYQRGGRSDKPHCLRPYIQSDRDLTPIAEKSSSSGPKRQSRHVGKVESASISNSTPLNEKPFQIVGQDTTSDRSAIAN